MAKNKYKNTTGRKHISKSGTVLHRGELIPVNANLSGCYTYMLKKSFEQFDIGLDKWKRQVFIRIDLHQSELTENNTRLTQFRKRLTAKLTAHYGPIEMGYCWARELGKAQAQHYHMNLWLDGDLIKTSHYVRKYAKQIWEEMGGFFTNLRTTYIYVNTPEKRLEALYWLSYLAKSRSKGIRCAQTKDYSTSRLKQ